MPLEPRARDAVPAARQDRGAPQRARAGATCRAWYIQTKEHLKEGHLATRAIICEGDTTSHGGKVIEGSPTDKIDGRCISGVGHRVACPRCKGVFPILPDLLGRRYPHRMNGRDTAVEGMRTACGAVLIASQSSATITDDGEADPYTGGVAAASAAAAGGPPPPSPTLCLECLKAAAESGATTVMRG
jgi:uncharacterized Zn-binding protein involved in type VI secretion